MDLFWRSSINEIDCHVRSHQEPTAPLRAITSVGGLVVRDDSSHLIRTTYGPNRGHYILPGGVADEVGGSEFDHVGVVVNNLEATAQVFADLGFERGEPFEVGGSWVDRIIGLEGARVEGIMVTAPGGNGKLELIKFHEPTRAGDQTELPANAHGYRHMAFQVTDIDIVVAQARAAGYDTVGDIVDFENVFLLAYIRTPEGLIVEVA